MSIQVITKAHEIAFRKVQTSRVEDEDPKIILKLFDPRGGSVWFFTELETDLTKEDNGYGYGFVRLNNWNELAECGGIDIFEVLNIRRRREAYRGTDLKTVRMGARDSVGVVERDLHFPINKYRLNEVMEKIRNAEHV